MWVPEKVLTNADLERMVDTTDEWITERTGIKERRIAGDDMTAVEMGYRAGKAAVADAGLEPADVDAIIVSTATPDRLLPATACDIQARLEARDAVAFDVWGACSGWLYAINIGSGLILSEQAETVLCVATEKMSAIVDWTDRATCVLFGDAAGATVLRRSGGNGHGILSTYMRSDGTLAELLYRSPLDSGSVPVDVAELAVRDGYLRMAGREVFKNAVRSMCEAVDAVLEKAGVTKDEIDLLVPHQANIRIIEATARYAGLSMDRVWVNVDRYGNTSSATIPVALHEAREAGRIEEGSLVLMVTFGAGLTWAGMLIRW
ncbi:MAG: ketoacyl-ACP synthase III [Gemmatimonadetes bacterium]|uniref:Beta-ketoacyl-[acyl-carrier-protein] synthase III n=1 Tax=Candidatus Kutchimonas denitrificans TaxID=3056748 RepID=A0AAE5CC19_9BACT|nr:ketoacyl-ACP synthase III [Gemmatimonadota bacterium]NIR75228.1 ketoacyl-ACP synthase III [Candidatus Kutchimonas denitrificans]NIS00166.1 ketoacyl-ACP synthase III [Gemmatimonadota bacterium]NIT65758.1 ketoacyl-ACP synthase III [Gemmatimonadota bacterium]NIU53036.1 beta-ketoacyl-ACP synthase III [Gemmatimonadota bacterium]